MINVPGQAMTIYALTQDITEIALKDRKFFGSNGKSNKQKVKSKIKPNWHNLRKKKTH